MCNFLDGTNIKFHL